MKKILAVLMTLCILFTVTACGGSTETIIPPEPTSSTESEKTPITQPVAEDYAVILQMSINPKFNMYITKSNKVIKIEPANDDATAFLDGVEQTSNNYIHKVAELTTLAIQKGYLKKGGKVEFAIIDTKDTFTKGDDILKKASKSATENAQKAGLQISTNIDEKKDKDTESKKDTASKKEPSSKPASSKDNSSKNESKKPTSSKENTSSKKPVTSTDKEDKDEAKTLNPKTDLPYEKEYAGNYRLELGDLVGSGVSFHTEGGIDGPYCLLLSPTFEAKRTDPDQRVFEYNGKKYYSIGAGMTPHHIEITETEVIVKNSFYEETETINLRLALKSNNTFVVTFSQLSEYPKGLVLEFLR